MADKQTVCLDFDGVIHSYKSGWQGIDVIPDPPVEGSKEAIQELRNKGWEVVVFSSRSKESRGVEAIKKYLADNGIEVDQVVADKPPAQVYVDDRGVPFKGSWPDTLKDIQAFKHYMGESLCIVRPTDPLLEADSSLRQYIMEKVAHMGKLPRLSWYSLPDEIWNYIPGYKEWRDAFYKEVDQWDSALADEFNEEFESKIIHSFGRAAIALYQRYQPKYAAADPTPETMEAPNVLTAYLKEIKRLFLRKLRQGYELEASNFNKGIYALRGRMQSKGLSKGEIKARLLPLRFPLWRAPRRMSVRIGGEYPVMFAEDRRILQAILGERYDPSYFKQFRSPSLRVYTRDTLASGGMTGMVMQRVSTARSVYGSFHPFLARKRTEYALIIFQDTSRRTLGVMMGTDLHPERSHIIIPEEVVEEFKEAAAVLFIHNHPTAYMTTSSRLDLDKWYMATVVGEDGKEIGRKRLFPWEQLSPSPQDIKAAEAFSQHFRGVEGYLVGPDGCSRYYPYSNLDLYLPNAPTEEAARRAIHFVKIQSGGAHRDAGITIEESALGEIEGEKSQEIRRAIDSLEESGSMRETLWTLLEATTPQEMAVKNRQVWHIAKSMEGEQKVIIKKHDGDLSEAKLLPLELPTYRAPTKNPRWVQKDLWHRFVMESRMNEAKWTPEEYWRLWWGGKWSSENLYRRMKHVIGKRWEIKWPLRVYYPSTQRDKLLAPGSIVVPEPVYNNVAGGMAGLLLQVVVAAPNAEGIPSRAIYNRSGTKVETEMGHFMVCIGKPLSRKDKDDYAKDLFGLEWDSETTWADLVAAGGLSESNRAISLLEDSGSLLETVWTLLEKTTPAEMMHKNKKVWHIAKSMEGEQKVIIKKHDGDLSEAEYDLEALLKKYERIIHRLKGVDFAMNTKPYEMVRDFTRMLLDMGARLSDIAEPLLSDIDMLGDEVYNLVMKAEDIMGMEMVGRIEEWMVGYGEVMEAYKEVSKRAETLEKNIQKFMSRRKESSRGEAGMFYQDIRDGLEGLKEVMDKDLQRAKKSLERVEREARQRGEV